MAEKISPPQADPMERLGLPRGRWVWAHVALLVATLGLLTLSVTQMLATEAGARREGLTIAGTIPNVRFTPLGQRLPVVALVAHGFSASKEIMADFGIELARQGVTTYVFDLPGHGASAIPFDTTALDDEGNPGQLVATVNDVARYALAHADPTTRLVLIGHSMGTSAVGGYALGDLVSPRLAATVLVSPVLSADHVTAASLANALIVVGERDPAGIIADGHALLAAACHTASVPGAACVTSAGARRLVTIAGVDHITILTASATHRAVLAWLGATVDTRIASGGVLADQRMNWLLLGMGAALAALYPILALAALGLGMRPGTRRRSTLRADVLAAMLAMGLLAVGLAIGVLVVHATSPSPLAFVRQMFAGELTTVWLVAGLVLLAGALRLASVRQQVRALRWRPALAQAFLALGALVFLYLTMGMISSHAWASFTLTPERLWRGVLLFVLLMPFFAGIELLFGRFEPSRPWLGTISRLGLVVLIVAALETLIRLDPGRFGFIALLLIVIAIFLLLFVAIDWLARRALGRPGVFMALMQALFLAWAVAATFPLVR
jgi:dienelactone hydrolase